MELDFVRVECDVAADSSAQLITALYNSLRNFEPQFKALCCLNQQEACISCSLHSGCPYQIVFGQELSSDLEIVRLHQKPSLPFSLYINGIDGNTSSCTVGMVVIGRAVNYIGLFHTVLLRMVETAVCTVLPRAKVGLRSYSLDYRGVRHKITHAASLPENVILLSGRHILQNTIHADSVILSLKSPLRLLSNGSIANKFDFSIFFRSQLRRCSSLCAYYGDGELDLYFTTLSESARNVTVLEDNSHYIKPPWFKCVNRSGLIGTVECNGLVEPMFSLLLLGSYFNAGKGATFGSGFYQIAVIG